MDLSGCSQRGVQPLSKWQASWTPIAARGLGVVIQARKPSLHRNSLLLFQGAQSSVMRKYLDSLAYCGCRPLLFNSFISRRLYVYMYHIYMYIYIYDKAESCFGGCFFAAADLFPCRWCKHPQVHFPGPVFPPHHLAGCSQPQGSTLCGLLGLFVEVGVGGTRQPHVCGQHHLAHIKC